MPLHLPPEPTIFGTQCRLCAELIRTDSDGVLISDRPEVREWITKFLRHLNILSDDCLTKSCCSACYQKLEQFNSFSENALQTQTVLYSAFIASTASTSSSSATTLSHLPHPLPTPRNAIKIKQEPIVTQIKEEQNAPPPRTELAKNLSSLLSAFCHYDLNSDHIMEITDLTNDFINLTEEDPNDGDEDETDVPGEEEINIKPNILLLKQEQGCPYDELDCDGGDEEDQQSRAIISNEHSYCKSNEDPPVLDKNILRRIKTEKREHDQPQIIFAAHPAPTPASLSPIPLVTIPKIHIIDNALLKHPCDTCGELFETRLMLSSHQQRLHNDRFECPLCKKRAANFPAFYYHKLNCCYRMGYLTVKGAKYWQCGPCGSQFKLQLAFQNHRKRNICRKLLKFRTERRRKKVILEQLLTRLREKVRF